jgi:hypothetical protein
MTNSSEIAALINLIEDPDELVYQSITDRFIEHGQPIIPVLKEQLDFTHDLCLQKRIDEILFKISITVLEKGLNDWKFSSNADLTQASIVISQFIDNETNQEEVIFELEKIKKSVWLELHDYLTPLEEINVINKILFSYYKFEGVIQNQNSLNEFDFNKLIITKKGNSFTFSAFYTILCSMLSIDVKPVNIPQQNLLAYFSYENFLSGEPEKRILFFIDPMSGQIFTYKNILEYLQKINKMDHLELINDMNNIKFIHKWLMGLSKAHNEIEETIKHSSIVSLANKFIGIQI